MTTVPHSDPVKSIRGAVFVTAGIALLWFVFTHVQSTRELLTGGRRVQGTVVKLSAGTSHPAIEFEDARGRKVMFSGNGFVSHRVGERVAVIYRDQDPETSAVLDEPGALWFFDVLTGVLGCAFIVGGVVSTIRR